MVIRGKESVAFNFGGEGAVLRVWCIMSLDDEAPVCLTVLVPILKSKETRSLLPHVENCRERLQEFFLDFPFN